MCDNDWFNELSNREKSVHLQAIAMDAMCVKLEDTYLDVITGVTPQLDSDLSPSTGRICQVHRIKIPGHMVPRTVFVVNESLSPSGLELIEKVSPGLFYMAALHTRALRNESNPSRFLRTAAADAVKDGPPVYFAFGGSNSVLVECMPFTPLDEFFTRIGNGMLQYMANSMAEHSSHQPFLKFHGFNLVQEVAGYTENAIYDWHSDQKPFLYRCNTDRSQDCSKFPPDWRQLTFTFVISKNSANNAHSSNIQFQIPGEARILATLPVCSNSCHGMGFDVQVQMIHRVDLPSHYQPSPNEIRRAFSLRYSCSPSTVPALFTSHLSRFGYQPRMVIPTSKYDRKDIFHAMTRNLHPVIVSPSPYDWGEPDTTKFPDIIRDSELKIVLPSDSLLRKNPDMTTHQCLTK